MENKNSGTKHFPDLLKCVPPPASSDKVGLFYAATQEKDAKLSCFGHVRMDLGSDGKESRHTWRSRSDEALNTRFRYN